MKIVFSFPEKILQKNNRDMMQEILNAGSIEEKAQKGQEKKGCINRCWISKVFLLACQLQVWTCANGRGGFLPSSCGSTGCGVFTLGLSIPRLTSCLKLKFMFSKKARKIDKIFIVNLTLTA